MSVGAFFMDEIEAKEEIYHILYNCEAFYMRGLLGGSMKRSIVKKYSIFLTAVAISFTFSACSNTPNKKAKTSINSTNTHKKSVEHTHPKSKCINAVTHAHPKATLEHKHYYHNCNASNKKSNAHIHPATKYSKFFRHVHPNGANKHSHH